MPDAASSNPRRIALVHSYYSSDRPSGENVVVDLQAQALREAGYRAEVFAVHTDAVSQSRGYQIHAAARVATGRGRHPARRVRAFGPDVVHVHNLFPNFSRSWVSQFSDRLVATLHNYRPMCPAGTLFRDGATCLLCPQAHSALPAIRHGCVMGNRIATVPVALGTRFEHDPVLSSAQRLVMLNENMLATYSQLGVDPQRLVSVPNFVRDYGLGPHRGDDRGAFWVFVGRLSAEKGIDRLVHRWPSDQRLVVVGSGPLQSELQTLARPGVEFVGQLPYGEVRDLIGRAQGLLFPSVWPEGLPTVYLEALSAGTPVLADSRSIVGDLVLAQRTGLVLDDHRLEDALPAVVREFESMSRICRRTYEDNYTQDAWVSAIGDVYRSVAAPG